MTTPLARNGRGAELHVPRQAFVRDADDRVRAWQPLVVTRRVLSNGGGSVNERTTAFEGAVPNIIANYIDDRFEGEFYLGYYKAIRSEGGSGGGGATGCSGLVDTNCLGTSQTGGRGTWDFLPLLGQRRHAHEQHVVSRRAL